MDVETVFTVVGAIGACAGAWLRYDAYPSHDAVGLLTEGVSGLELVVVGAIAQQRAAKAGVDCRVFGRCEGMPHSLGDLFGPYVIGAFKGATITAIAIGLGWAVARLTRRTPDSERVAGR